MPNIRLVLKNVKTLTSQHSRKRNKIQDRRSSYLAIVLYAPFAPFLFDGSSGFRVKNHEGQRNKNSLEWYEKYKLKV